jgi:predicted transcriptional regulator
LPEYVDTYRREVVEEGTTAEIVVRSSILDRLLATYWEPVNDTLSTDRFTIYEITDDPPYSLKLGATDGGSEVALVTYGDQGVSGFVRTDSPAAVEWAERVYADVKSRANLIAPMD